MSKVGRVFLYIFGIVLITISGVKAQESEELYIFGFSQTLYTSKLIESTSFPFPADTPTNGIPFEISRNFESNTFALHQLNLFFRKNIDNKTTFFLNLEATGSYSSQLNSGNFQIPEGWISHDFSEKFRIKAGLMVPKFNNLNEIKNRLPLFPYLIRPTIYEALFYGVFQEEDYVPQSAYLQISGSLPVFKKYFFEYSMHIGNSEASYASQIEPGEGDVDLKEGATIYKGENLTTKLGFGGRIGLKNTYETVKLGLSSTRDHDNRNEVTEGSISRFPGLVLPVFGDVPRYRIGADLSFTYKKFNFEGEYIGVFHNHTELRKTPQYKFANLNKCFYYGVLTYNISDKFYTFIGHNKLSDNSYEFLLEQSLDKAGLIYNTFGGGWKIADDIVLKTQFSNVRLGKNPHSDVEIILFTTGVSVLF